MALRRLVGMSTVMLLAGCAARQPVASQVKRAYDGYESPDLVGRIYERRFYALPLASGLQSKPWTEQYWPSNRGGIARRWNDPRWTDAFNDHLLTAAEASRATYEQLKLLSPAEKYDIVQNRFDYPTVQTERRRNWPNAVSWAGLCHGVAPASLNFAEPGPVDAVTPSGIRVPFAASDIKALLAFAQAQLPVASHTAGLRCDVDLSREPWRGSQGSCRGLDAGSFHLVLANQIGLQGRGFIVDLPRSWEIWNHAVYAYSSEVYWHSYDVYAGAAAGTRQVVGVRTRIHYIKSTWSSWGRQPIAQFPDQVGTSDYDYLLELSGDGTILGGEWKSQARPAFVWNQDRPTLDGYYANLKLMYDGSMH